MTNNIRRRVTITKHAEQRLKERAPNLVKKYPSLHTLAQSARYKGKGIDKLSDDEYLYYEQNLSLHHKNDKILLYEGVWFVFEGNHGHHRTLITVISNNQ